MSTRGLARRSTGCPDGTAIGSEPNDDEVRDRLGIHRSSVEIEDDVEDVDEDEDEDEDEEEEGSK